MSMLTGINTEVFEFARRSALTDFYDEKGICIHVWHSGLGKNPWMLEIRKMGVLYGSFEGVQPGFPTRQEAEDQAFDIAESFCDGTFELRFTS